MLCLSNYSTAVSLSFPLHLSKLYRTNFVLNHLGKGHTINKTCPIGSPRSVVPRLPFHYCSPPSLCCCFLPLMKGKRQYHSRRLYPGWGYCACMGGRAPSAVVSGCPMQAHGAVGVWRDIHAACLVQPICCGGVVSGSLEVRQPCH